MLFITIFFYLKSLFTKAKYAVKTEHILETATQDDNTELSFSFS